MTTLAVPQVIVTLDPKGNLQLELPGANGARRRLEIKSSRGALDYGLRLLSELNDMDGEARAKALASLANTFSKGFDESLTETLRRILLAQAARKVAIGEDGAPTEAQVRHWQRHTAQYPGDGCAFCIAEGWLNREAKPSQAKALAGRIRHLDQRGALDWEYRSLLSVRQAPLARKRGAQRAETWRDRAVALRERLFSAEAGIIVLAKHGGAVVRKLPARGAKAGRRPKAARSANIPVDLALLG